MTPINEDRLAALIEEELPELIKIRHELHANPGVRFEEEYASKLVQRELQNAGIQFRAGLAGGTGVLGHLPGAAPEAIGLRADMDALPILEENTFPYASTKPGFMHACGHDGHTTILLGAARVLARVAKEHTLPRPVTFVFQPAEEGGAGGDLMVKDGALDGSIFPPPVKHMFGLHGWPELELGQIATRIGPITAATCVFQITVKGAGCHAAFPHYGRDPIVAAAAIISATQSIVARNVDPLASAVVSITQCNAGSATNIIPEKCSLQGTIRTLDTKVTDLVQKRFSRIVEQTAQAYDCEAKVEYQLPNYPVTNNSAEAIGILKKVLPHADLGMAPVMGGEDFAYYSQVVPSGFFVIGLSTKEKKVAGLHRSTFDFNDDAIRVGVDAFCRLALRRDEA